MPVRHLLLAAGAVLVMGMCVYLFLQVRATTAVAQTTPRDKPSADPEGQPEPDKTDKPDPADPANRRIPGAPRSGSARKPPEPSVAADPTPSAPTTNESDKDKLEGPKLDAVMAEANKAYDKQDFEEARAIAQRVLKQHPDNVRMLRIMTSIACVEVDAPEAQKWFNLLPAPDREQMKTRCTRYGVTFTPPPAK